MKKVNFSSVHTYKTGEFLECSTLVADIFAKAPTLPEKLSSRLKDMNAAIVELDKVFNLSSAEVNTAELTIMDKQRLSILQSMSYLARAMQKRSDPEKIRSGEILGKVLSHNCNRIVIESYPQKTSLINAFLKDVKESPEITEAIAKLDLSGEISELTRLNIEFSKAFDFGAQSKNDPPKTEEKRDAVRKIFMQLMRETEAFSIAAEDPTVFEGIVKSVDKLLRKFDKPVLMRQSIRKSKKLSVKVVADIENTSQEEGVE